MLLFQSIKPKTAGVRPDVSIVACRGFDFMIEIFISLCLRIQGFSYCADARKIFEEGGT